MSTHTTVDRQSLGIYRVGFSIALFAHIRKFGGREEASIIEVWAQVLSS